MALCVGVVGTALEVLGEYSESCTGFALMTAQEYAATPTLAALFAQPDASSVQSAFMAGLSLPLILWLSAWGFGTVVKFINYRTDQPSIIED